MRGDSNGATDPLQLANNLPLIDEMYARFSADPQSVDPSWRALFGNGKPAPSPVGWEAKFAGEPAGAVDWRAPRVAMLVEAYRDHGHLAASLDPLDHLPRQPHPD